MQNLPQGKQLHRACLRKQLTMGAEMTGDATVPIIISHVFHDGLVLLKSAEERGSEGIVSKRKDLRYQSDTCSHWRKTKSGIWFEANKDRFEKMRK